MISHFLTFFKRNGASVLEVALVANEDASYVVLSVLLDLTHPCMHCVERVAIGDVIDNDDAVGALVVARSNRLETLLTSSIPNL